MTTSEAEEEVARVISDAISKWVRGLPANVDLPRWMERQAAIALSVPSVAEVIARDAKVRAEVDETRARCEREQLGHDGTMWEAADLGVAIAALYPEAGK